MNEFNRNKEFQNNTCIEISPPDKNNIKILLQPMKQNLLHYKFQMIKMKLSFMAWSKNTSIFTLFHDAIVKTLIQIK